MAELSERGFEQYGAVETDHGHRLRVYESSAARGPHVWLNVCLADEHRGIKPEEATAHLSLFHAMELRGLLDDYIEGVPERWEKGASLYHEAGKEWREKYPELVLKATRRNCQCCHFGNHDFPCVCDGQDCCHPDRHAPDKDVPAVPELMCSVCHHAEERHTASLPEEGSKDYCTECSGTDEYHAFNEAPESPQEDFLDRLRAIVPPGVPDERVRGVARLLADLWQIPYDRDGQQEHPLWVKAAEVAGPGASKRNVAQTAAALAAHEWFTEEAPPVHMEGMRAPLVQYDEAQGTAAAIDATYAVRQQEDEDLAVEDVCRCGHIRSQHTKTTDTWGASCQMCGALGGATNYHWRHEFSSEEV
jgi:hypothetical protein